MMQEDEKAKVIQAFGGKKGIIDSSVPSLLFVFTQSIAHNLKISLIVALSTAVILTCIRILKKDSLLHSFSGLIGVILGPILGEDTRWRKDTLRLRAYTMASWVWFSMFAIRFVVQYFLFHKDYLTALGIANIFLGLPLYLLTLWATWEIIKRVPTTSAAQSTQGN